MNVIFKSEVNPENNERNPVAVFPECKEMGNTQTVLCYSHEGQHSSGELSYFKNLPLSSKKEYEPLLKELKSIGYDNLTIIEDFDMTPEQIKHKEDFINISIIADKVLDFMKENSFQEREKWCIMQDFEIANKQCPMNLEMLKDPEHIETLVHDYFGIYNNLHGRNSGNPVLDENFLPRSAYRKETLEIAGLLDDFFNSEKINFSKNECLMFAEEIDYEDFTTKKEGNEIIFANPNVPEENVSWKFQNTPSGRHDFVKDLLQTHKDFSHKNHNDDRLKEVLKRTSTELKQVQKKKEPDYEIGR